MNVHHLKKFVFYIVMVLVAISIQRCANPMAPTGGPKDILPPKVIGSMPHNESTNFKGNSFTLYFDEYVKLDKINQQLLISPPMQEFPDIKLKGKTLNLKFKEALKANTTYSVFFGDAIKDITEGNILHNFSYIFSTGSTLDSMSLRGKVVGAFDLKPAKDISVMLYKNNNDSLPLDKLPLYVKPYYISKTNEKGVFNFSGLSDTTYLLFAVQDQNYSLTFDQPAEKIAFFNSLVRPQYRPRPHIDSSLFDTITKLPHNRIQLMIDSLWNIADSLSNSKLTLHKLYLFQQADTIQRLLKTELLRKNALRFIFRLPSDSIHITSLNFHPDSLWYLSEWNKDKDTLLWFLRNNHPDTLKLIVADGFKNLDTLDIRAIPIEKFSKHKKKETAPQKEYLSWNSNVSREIKPRENLEITFDYPVKVVNPDSMLLITDKDTLIKPDFYFADTLHRKMVIPLKVKPATSYKILIPDSTVIGWNGLHNKSIDVRLKAKETKEYGTLTFNLQPVKNARDYILQMMTSNDNVIKQVYFSKPKQIQFENIQPGSYKFKIIVDANNNKKWDTGNYLKKQEPEKVIYYKKTIKIRPNWEIDEIWRF